MEKPNHENRGIRDGDVAWDEHAGDEILSLPKGLQMNMFARDPAFAFRHSK